MFRLLVVPVSIGILAFICIYFISPAIVKEVDTVSYVGESILYFSNSYFATMPSFIASYVANLDLAIIALTAGLLLMAGVQLVVIIGGTLIRMIGWIVSWLRKDRSKVVNKDLPPIEMEPRYLRETPGKEILGRGIDSIDRE